MIVDAVFAEPTERRAIEDIAAASGTAFLGLWLETDPSMLERRVRDRRLDASDASIAVLRRQLEKPIRHLRWERIDAGGTPESVERLARRALALGNSQVDSALVERL